MSAVFTGARADVDDPVGRADGVLVVFDDDQRVAEVAEAGEGLDQPAVVTLVETDRRLVEDVQDAGETGPDLRRETDALCLAAGQRPGRTRQRQIFQADVEQEADAGLYFLENAAGDRGLTLVEMEVVEEVGAFGDRQRTDLGDRLRAVLGGGSG